MRCTRSHTVWDIVAIDIIVAVGCAYGRVAIVALSRPPVGSNSVNPDGERRRSGIKNG